MAMFAIPIVVDDHFAPEDDCEVVGDNFAAESSDEALTCRAYALPMGRGRGAAAAGLPRYFAW